MAEFTEHQIAEVKTAVDAAVQKKLDQTEGKIKEQSEHIAKLLETQEKTAEALKVAQRESLALRQTARGNYAGKLSNEHVARGIGLIGLSLMGRPNARKELEKDFGTEVRAMGEGTETAGGVLVPELLSAELIRLVNEYGVIRQNSRVVPLSTGGDTTYPKRTGGLTVYNPSEGGTITASQLTLGGVALRPKKLATLTAISSELDEDAVIAVGELLATEIAYAFAVAEDTDAFLGDGTSTYHGINGLFNAAGAGCTSSMDGDEWTDITLANATATIALLQQYAETGAKWYMHRASYFGGFVDAALAAGGVTAEEVRSNAFRGNRTFLGYPVVLTSACPGTEAATTDFGVFGDLMLTSYFGQRRAVEIARSTDVYFTTDQIGIRGTERIDFVAHDVGTASVAGGYVVLTSGS